MIDNNNSYFYIEINKQIKFSLIAINDLNSELCKLNSPNVDKERFWYSIQSFLISVANISKILYPSPTSKDSNKQRAKLLRNELKLEKHSVLANKQIRNCFEHFDEHLDKFIEDLEKNHGIFIDTNISNENSIVIEGMGRNFYLRNYNPRTRTLTFKNKSYELQPVVDEILKLKQKIEQVQAQKAF